jgi:Ca-activated chloride channel family protein
MMEQIRATTDQLTAALRTERPVELTAGQRDAVLSAVGQPPVQPARTRERSIGRRITWFAALAASLLLAVGAGWLLRGMTPDGQTRETAMVRPAGDSSNVAANPTPVSAQSEPHTNVLPPAETLMHPGPGVVGPGPGMLAGYHHSGSQNQDGDKSSVNSLNLQFGSQDLEHSAGAEPTLDANAPISGSYQVPPSLGGVDPNQIVGVSLSAQPNSRGVTVSGGTITGTNTYTGGTVIDGSLNVSGSVQTTPYGATSSSGKEGIHGAMREPVSHTSSGTLTVGGINANQGTLKLGTGTLNSSADAKPSTAMQESFSRMGYSKTAGTLTVNNSLPAQSQPLGPPRTEAAMDTSLERLRNMKLADVQYRQNSFSGATSESELASMPQGRPTINGASVLDLQGNNTSPGLAGERDFNTESYDHLVDNPFLATADNPLSTFSIDVDTGSYSNIRRFLMQQNQLPPPGAVRIEELVNYFRYDYPQPTDERPFSVTTEVASCPWQSEHRLVRIGLKGREIPKDKRPPSSIVFLIDVSGSMEQPNKLPLVQQSLKLLTEQLGENDHVAIVVYAGRAGLVLPSTTGDHRQAILEAIDRLRAGGSTNGAQGIQLAYEIASQNFIKGGINRVLLATDGDFNVGVTNQDALVRLIQEHAKSGVFLTVLGFGYGNLKDSTMEKLADKGNGAYAYIDDLPEARKMLVEQLGSTLITIAKDVKIQIEFNPAAVAGYRLIGYEKRLLAKEDFNNDKKDAGEIGAGHTVTALYEIVPTPTASSPSPPAGEGRDEGEAAESAAPAVDALKYVKPAALTDAAKSGELLTLKLRYKQPDGDKSTLMETPVKDSGQKYGQATADFKFAAAVAAFGMILRDSEFKGNATLGAVQELAKEAVEFKATSADAKSSETKTGDDSTYRAEFLQLVDKAKSLKGP